MVETVQLQVGPKTIPALVAVPAGKGPFPGVVVTFHREGNDPFTRWLVDDLDPARRTRGGG